MNVPNLQYHSPTVQYDSLAQVVIVRRVNPENGEVLSQTPNEATMVHERIAALGGGDKVEPVAATPAAVPVEPSDPSAAMRPAPAQNSVSLIV